MLEAGLVPARVVIQKRDIWQVLTLGADAFDASLLGKFRAGAQQGEFPVVGDWVGLEVAGTSARIHHVLPRTTTLIRKAAGGDNVSQVIGANIDLGLLVCALNEDFNPRRLERYIALCRAGGITPLIVLTKADLVTDLEPYLQQLDDVAAGITIIPVSALTDTGMSALLPWLVVGQTAALLGSSGAGKSTLLNTLMGSEVMATSDIRYSDGRGRHTTTHRELVTLPSGAMIIDSPGMRELALWDGAAGVTAAFDDVEALVAACRFSDCQHKSEPDCAVRVGLESGALEPSRWASFQKLSREQVFEQAKTDPLVRAETKKLWKRRNANYVAAKRLRDVNSE
jgi:ribosome biogenesis GTPase / thiamine phosphate phosphatase